MIFKHYFEAFDFLNDLEIKLRKQGQIESAEFLLNYLKGAGATTSTEAMSLMVGGLEEFLEKFPDVIDDIETQKIKYSIEAYLQGLR